MAAARGRRLRPTGLRPSALGALLVLPTATPAEVRAACRGPAPTRSTLLVAVDGGFQVCRRAGRFPDLFIGDGDSAGGVPSGLPAVVYPVDKDRSDLAGALGEVARRGAELATVIGLLGGRLDHEWANVQELGRVARRFRAILAPTPRGLVAVTAAGWTGDVRMGTTFSVLPLTASATLTLRGARWPLQRARVRRGSHGLSNVATAASVRLTVHAGVIASVFPG